MSRRAKKLTRTDRGKKADKRARRAEEAPQRLADREVRERWAKIPLAVKRRFAQIGQLYENATRNPVVSEVVCEECGFAQPYGSNDDPNLPKDDDENVICLRGPALGMPCEGIYCITTETFEARFSGS